MTLQSRDWEQPLLAMAYEAKLAHQPDYSLRGFEPNLLAEAYAYCEQMTAWHSRSFSLASRLLPARKRLATRALYAFCRTTDDIVDFPGDDVSNRLNRWRSESLAARPPVQNLVAVAWADARTRYQVPHQYAQQLIDGVARDLHQTRYETFEELTNYCYGVASTVGLMSMHIIGYSTEAAIGYAVKLGVALQLTNILRDVAEDWQRGRLYLPQEELAAFNLGEADIAAGRVTERWRKFMQFQIDRTHRLYNEAWPGIAMLKPEGRLAIIAAADFYRGILKNIEENDYDVFSRRAHVTKWGKIRRIPALWWQTQRMGNQRVH